MALLDPVRRFALEHSLIEHSPDARVVIEAYHYLPGDEAFPALPLLSYRLHGGQDDDGVLPLTCAYYLTNLASEVLDDMMDGERKTPWADWPLSRTVLAAVELLALSQDCLAKTPTEPATLREITERFSEAVLITSKGQRQSVERIASLTDYWRQATLKSGAFFAFGMWSGARLAHAPESDLAAALRFGARLGLLSQVMDDVFDFVTETPDTRDASIEFDSALPVVMALASTSGDVSVLQEALVTPVSERNDIWHRTTRQLILTLGGLANALAIGQKYREDLLGSLSTANPSTSAELRHHIESLTAIIGTAASLTTNRIAEHDFNPD